MKYATQGKRSLAWWLQAVKWFGPDGNKGIMRGGEVATHHVKFAMQDLLNRHYITRSGGGKGKRDLSYHLTETGGRYLDEHEAELEAPTEDHPQPIAHKFGAAATGVHHSVPKTPEWKGPAMPPENYKGHPRGRPPKPAELPRDIKAAVDLGVAIAEHVATNGGVPIDDTQHPTPEPEILRHADSEAGASLTTSDEPPKPATQSSLQRMRTDSVKKALKNLLYEKHADEISAKELIAYMESSND